MIDLNRHFPKEDIHMPIRSVNNCSTSLTIRGVQVKTSASYDHTQVRRAINKRQAITGIGQDMDKREVCVLLVGM